jgi:DNA primase
VLRLLALGIPAVALLGVHATRAQLALLASVPKLTLLFDGDPAGREGARTLADRLKGTSQTRIVLVPDGLDPDDLDDLALRSLVETQP